MFAQPSAPISRAACQRPVDLASPRRGLVAGSERNSPLTSRLLVIHRLGHPWRVHASLGQTHHELQPGRDTLSVGVDRIQRNFEPMQRQVESWRQTQIANAHAKLIFYSV